MVDERHNAAHRALQSDVADKSPRIDAGNYGNAISGQVIFERFGRTPITRQWRKALYDERLQEGFPGLDVFRINAGIADQRIRHRHDLAGVRWVGQDLLITRHRSIENNFAQGFAFKAVSIAAENTPVFEQQRGVLFQSRDPILFMGQYLKTALP